MAFPPARNDQVPDDPELPAGSNRLEDTSARELAEAGDAAAEALASASVLGADQHMASADEQAANVEEARERSIYGISHSEKAGDVHGLEKLEIPGLDILTPGLEDEQ